MVTKMDENLPISEQYRIIAKKWVDAESAASILEETKSSLLANMMLQQGDIPVSRAEMKSKASEPWREFLRDMVGARETALRLKVQLEYIRMKFHEWQSAEATRRAEMKL